jgi:hypothetical protein
MSAARNDERRHLSAEARRNDTAALEHLSAAFDRRLNRLKGPETRRRVARVMRAHGKAKQRPIAGPSY